MPDDISIISICKTFQDREKQIAELSNGDFSHLDNFGHDMCDEDLHHAIFQAAINPIRQFMNCTSIVRKCLVMDPLPQGVDPRYEMPEENKETYCVNKEKQPTKARVEYRNGHLNFWAEEFEISEKINVFGDFRAEEGWKNIHKEISRIKYALLHEEQRLFVDLLNSYVPKGSILSFDKKTKIDDINYQIMLRPNYRWKMLLNPNTAEDVIKEDCEFMYNTHDEITRVGYIGNFPFQVDYAENTFRDIPAYLCEEIADNEIFYLQEAEETGVFPIRTDIVYIDNCFLEQIGMAICGGDAIAKVVLL